MNRQKRKKPIPRIAIIGAVTLAFIITLSMCRYKPEELAEVETLAATIAPNASEIAPATAIATLVATTTPTSSPEPTYIELGEFMVYAYCPCVECCGIWSAQHSSRIGTGYIQKTASGTIPQAGHTIAVDLNVIPFGTTVYIDGRAYVAEDKGGAIKGNKIDMFYETHQEAVDFGVQIKKVYILEEN